MPDIPHAFPFDPRYGYSRTDLQQLRASDTEPDDFVPFWQDLYQQTLDVPLALERRTFPVELENWQVEEVYFTTLNQKRIGAWLVQPADGDVRFLRVIGHGYGGRDSCMHEEYVPHTAHLFPVAPGFHISADDALPLNDAGQHVVHGISDKNTYVFRECAASLWSSASVLLELYPELSQTLHYKGWSYGGGMGAIMLPWDKRYQCAELGQPSFGQYPLRLQCQCVGSGEAVRQYAKAHPEIVDQVLPYFDAATHATHITQPVLWIVCPFDPAVPPPGQYAVAQSCASEHHICEIEVGHYDAEYPGKIQELMRYSQASADFFNSHIFAAAGRQ